ncbi:DUF3649 domain-containing protein [Luteibacter sp. 3190]|uniref:DUF3649 domain-containing protein n=1 Tax=Luteibacter sp. 3190 TaxID=2817736 RepID=UPI002856246C|nr:DUF3649 domain-containing protein [Luteibacter sp. 3190]MDR6935783.1 putative membrane protein [Luteibacter sp. 3190]
MHPSRITSAANVASRIVVASLGGYVAAALAAATMARWLPMPRVEAVMTGTLASFAVYAGVAIMAFAVSTATRAWLWLAALCVPPAVALYLSMHGGAA